MAYTEQNDQVTLTMTRNDFDCLIISLGTAAGACQRSGADLALWSTIALMNRLNEGNPHYTPYEIPAEYAARINLEPK